MKREILLLSVIIGLTSCGFQSRKDFEKELNENVVSADDDFKMPKITYVEEGRDKRALNTDDMDYVELYGSGITGDNLSVEDAKGNLLDLDLDGYQYGISFLPSEVNPGAYSAFLSYIKNDELNEVEFGPVAGILNLTSVVTFDIINSESGPMLLVSQITVDPDTTHSEYILYNKYMSVIDSLSFSNSTEDTEVIVERLGNIIEDSDEANPGDIDTAIDRRMEMEEEYLQTLIGVYHIDEIELVATVGENDRVIGFLPDISDNSANERLILIKSNNSPESNGMNVNIE